MRWKAALFSGVAAGSLLACLSCVDESPTGPAAPPVFYPLSPGTQWTYQYVLNDSVISWMNILREEPVVVVGDTVWALDFISDGQVTLTQYMDVQDGSVYGSGGRTVAFTDTVVEVYDPPVRLSPVGRGPGEEWTTVTTWTQLKVAMANPPNPPDTLVTTGSWTWRGRVLGEERIEVPAFDEPVNTLLVEYYGEADPWTPPEVHRHMWLAENIGPVRVIDLTLGRTVNNLSEYIQGK